MKAIEILLETKKINEAPANIIGQGLKRLGAGVLGAMGASGMAGNLRGSADAGAKANELHAQFQEYLGRIGKKTKTAEYADLQAFLKANKINPSLAKGTGPLDQKVVDQIFMKVAQDSFKYGGGAPADDTSGTDTSAQGTQQSTPSQGSAGQSYSAPGSTQQSSPGTAQQTRPGATSKAPTMKIIKASIDALPKNQKAQIRKLVAAKAGVA